MKPSQCIWCLQSAGGKHVEHIVPEALGCPKGFVLTADQICQRCNNGLGYLDQAVADDFDFVGFLAGVTRKKRKAPGIMSRGNVYGFMGRDGPEIIFNMNATPMTARNGEHIAGYRGSARNIKASIHETGSSARITFESTIGTSKKFQRGIYKIAISALTYFVGSNELHKPKYDVLRDYVRRGTGTRHLMMIAESDAYRHVFVPPYRTLEDDYAMEFRLACVRFVVDLSESERHLGQVRAAAQKEMGERRWTLIPAQ